MKWFLTTQFGKIPKSLKNLHIYPLFRSFLSHSFKKVLKYNKKTYRCMYINFQSYWVSTIFQYDLIEFQEERRKNPRYSILFKCTQSLYISAFKCYESNQFCTGFRFWVSFSKFWIRICLESDLIRHFFLFFSLLEVEN